MANAQYAVGKTLVELQRYDEASPLLEAALATREARSSAGSTDVAEVELELARIARARHGDASNDVR